MQIAAIIMAGGKGSRFDFNKIELEHREKLLLPLGGRFLIEYVIDALLASKNINKRIIAVSPFTPHTKSIIEAINPPIELIETPGAGYHSDIKFIIQKLKLGITMTIAADIPLIKPEILDEIIDKYFILKRPALSVMADIKLFAEYGLTPTIIFQSDNGQKNIIPLGINIIDGNAIDQQKLDQAILISERVELIYNINTVDDYFQLKKFFIKIKNH
jgi:adenosylcobinamide-phosphate guanylyltransferase